MFETVSQLLSLLSGVIGPAVSVIGALATVITLSQARRQAREDAEHRKRQLANQERQAAAAEQNNEEIRSLTEQLAESNDPTRRQQIEAMLEDRLGRVRSVTPETLKDQLASTRATLRAEMREQEGRITRRIDDFVAYPDLVHHETLLSQAFRDAEALRDEIERQRQQEKGLNMAQLQRELLLRIGQDLIRIAEQVAPPTVRRAPPSGPLISQPDTEPQ